MTTTVIVVIALILVIYHFFKEQKDDLDYFQKAREEGRKIVRKHSDYNWDATCYAIEKGELVQPEIYTFYLELPNDGGSIFIKCNSRWNLQYVPKGHSMTNPFGIPLRENSLESAFEIGDKFYEAKMLDDSLNAEEFINRMKL